MCVYIYIYIHMYVYIYYIHIHTYIHTQRQKKKQYYTFVLSKPSELCMRCSNTTHRRMYTCASHKGSHGAKHLQKCSWCVSCQRPLQSAKIKGNKPLLQKRKDVSQASLIRRSICPRISSFRSSSLTSSMSLCVTGRLHVCVCMCVCTSIWAQSL